MLAFIKRFKKLVICGVGSRETPQHILDEMFKFGEWVRKEKHTIRSGHAQGADWAFERGAQERCIAYLPWGSFNTYLISDALKHTIHNEDKYIQFTNEYHQAPQHLKGTDKLLMNRNVCQVLGVDLQNPADLLICWTKNGSDAGGTGQAIRIAQANGVPIFNMYHEKYNTCEKLIDEIHKKFKKIY